MEIVHVGVPGDPDSSDSDSMGGKQSVAAGIRGNGGIVHGSSTYDGGFPASENVQSLAQSRIAILLINSRQVSGPNSAKKTMRPPMPTELGELEERFNEVLRRMDLPPEKAKHLRYVKYLN